MIHRARYLPRQCGHVAPLPSVYIVGERGAPVETWGQEANLFHNPKAKHPIPVDLFDTMTNSEVVNGQYIDRLKDDFKARFAVTHNASSYCYLE